MKCAIFEEHSSSCFVYFRFSGTLFPVSMLDGGISKLEPINPKTVTGFRDFFFTDAGVGCMLFTK